MECFYFLATGNMYVLYKNMYPRICYVVMSLNYVVFPAATPHHVIPKNVFAIGGSSITSVKIKKPS